MARRSGVYGDRAERVNPSIVFSKRDSYQRSESTPIKKMADTGCPCILVSPCRFTRHDFDGGEVRSEHFWKSGELIDRRFHHMCLAYGVLP